MVSFMISVSGERLDILHKSAMAWLEDEYTYQGRKFSEESYRESLNGSISNGTWGLASYVMREQIFREGGADLLAVQAAGKVASGGRAVYAATRLVQNTGNLSFDFLSRRSLAMLAAEDPRVWLAGGHNDTSFKRSPVMHAIWQFEDSLPRPVSADTLRPDDIKRAERVCHEAMGYFMRRLIARDNHQPQHMPPILPRAGAPSGQIEAWQPHVSR